MIKNPFDFHYRRTLFFLFFNLICQASSIIFLSASTSPPDPNNIVWEYNLPDFSPNSYRKGVQSLIASFENATGKRLTPGPKRKVAIKVYSASGPGLATPLHLLSALIQELELRGFSKTQIAIFDESSCLMRKSGFLPPVSVGGSSFEDVPVYPLDKDIYWDKAWFYSSPLPPSQVLTQPFMQEDDRKSFLPVGLFLDADFWINLPVVTSHESTGVSGAMTNPTLFAISNNKRFVNNPAHASIAIAEIAAIPELQETWAFTILSLEKFQFIGGSRFNSNYTSSEPILWLSKNASALDYKMIYRINRLRKNAKLPLIKGVPSYFDYLKMLNVADYSQAPVVKVNEPSY